MTYLGTIGLVGSVWLLADAIRKGISRDWRLRGQVLLSLVGVAYGCLDLYVVANEKMIHGARRNIVLSFKGVLVGAFVGIFATLFLAGWFRDILGKRREAILEEIFRAHREP